MSWIKEGIRHSQKYILHLLFIMTSIHVLAQGDLMITPHRVVLEGNKQIEEIVVANIGQDTAFYSISLIEYRMTEAVSYTHLDVYKRQ